MIKTSLNGHLTLKQQLSVLQLKPAKRRRLLKQTVRDVQKFSRARIRQGRDLNGKSWAARKGQGAGKGRKKMMKGLSRRLRNYATADRGTVDFKGGALTGKIARAQQEGINETMTSQRMQQIHGRPDYDAPATRVQARALKQEGFKRRRAGGKGFAKASMKWIRENMKQGQAGLVLQELRDNTSKKSWVIALPSRSFLGATKQEIDQLIQHIFNDTRQQLHTAGQR